MFNINEQSYFEQFSGHQSTDDVFWDKWAVIQNGFAMKEFDDPLDALIYCNQLPESAREPQVIYIEKAGYGDTRLKALALPIWITT